MLCASLSRSSAQCGLCAGQLVRVLVDVSEGFVFASTAIFSETCIPGENFFRRKLQYHSLPCSEDSETAAAGLPNIQSQIKIFPHLHMQ